MADFPKLLGEQLPSMHAHTDVYAKGIYLGLREPAVSAQSTVSSGCAWRKGLHEGIIGPSPPLNKPAQGTTLPTGLPSSALFDGGHRPW